MSDFFVYFFPTTATLWLYARQPGKVLISLNVQQSEIFTEFPLKDSFDLLDSI